MILQSLLRNSCIVLAREELQGMPRELADAVVTFNLASPPFNGLELHVQCLPVLLVGTACSCSLASRSRFSVTNFGLVLGLLILGSDRPKQNTYETLMQNDGFIGWGNSQMIVYATRDALVSEHYRQMALDQDSLRPLKLRARC